jgi:PrcB C-terminal
MPRFRLITLATLLTACAPGTQPNSPSDALTHDDPGTVILASAYSGYGEAERIVIRDPAAWDHAWATAWANHSPVPPLPPVDFDTEMVVLAALGSRPSGGYTIEIERVTSEAAGAAVRVLATSPAADCFVTQALTQPVIMLRTAAIRGAIRFHDRAEVRPCE